MKRIDSEKNTTTTVIDENVVMLSIEEKKCEHIIPTKGLLILQPLTILSLRRGCLPRTKQETLV